MKKQKVKSKPKVTRTFYIDCPQCKKEIKGTTEKQTIANLKIHFKLVHPDKDWDREVVF